MDRRVALIVNPAAGGGRAARALPAVQEALASFGLDVHVQRTTSMDHAETLGRAAGEAGELALAFGGDGIVGRVAAGLRGTDGMLGILPGGRGNDLARVLGIPRDPVEACAIVVRGAPRPLDLAEVDGSPYVGIASCGFDSDANRIANQTNWIAGQAVYLYAALRALAAWRPACFTLHLDGERLELSGYTVAAANSPCYGGGMRLAPGAALDDGLLDVVTIAAIGKLRFLSRLPKVFGGRHVEDEAVGVLRGRELHIEADRAFTVYADGDPIGELPVTVRALPAAVRVLAPS